jgi:hypothetical protein
MAERVQNKVSDLRKLARPCVLLLQAGFFNVPAFGLSWKPKTLIEPQSAVDEQRVNPRSMKGSSGLTGSSPRIVARMPRNAR